jgi:hypothetical protein
MALQQEKSKKDDWKKEGNNIKKYECKISFSFNFN